MLIYTRYWLRMAIVILLRFHTNHQQFFFSNIWKYFTDFSFKGLLTSKAITSSKSCNFKILQLLHTVITVKSNLARFDIITTSNVAFRYYDLMMILCILCFILRRWHFRSLSTYIGHCIIGLLDYIARMLGTR